MYGWRARIGLLVVASDVTCASELSRFSPEGVSFLTSRMDFPGKVTVETIEKLEESKKYEMLAVEHLESAGVILDVNDVEKIDTGN